ncbi:LOW QUALITY PROTEIN: hypothetical protein HID58_075791, partial [Brassica napus]
SDLFLLHPRLTLTPPQYSSSLYSAPPYTGGGSSIPPSSENDLRAEVTPPSFDDSYGDGVFAYSGGAQVIEFDFRLLSAKIIRAVPKADVQEGVQKFCVKLLAETYGQTTTDVLCQIGLDGLRMLDPSTSRTLRIYTLRDAKFFYYSFLTPVNIEAKRIRLQSNSYTTNTPLDTVTAAMFQAKEIWGSSRPPVSAKLVPDEAVSKCTLCGSDFGYCFSPRSSNLELSAMLGLTNLMDYFYLSITAETVVTCSVTSVLKDCSQPLTAEENAPQIRVFDRCMAEVSQRLSYAKESASRNVSVQSYGDLARKLLMLREI